MDYCEMIPKGRERENGKLNLFVLAPGYVIWLHFLASFVWSLCDIMLSME